MSGRTKGDYEELRLEADRVQRLWEAERASLNAYVEALPDHGATPDAELQARSDRYNRLNEVNVAIQHRLAEVIRRDAERAKFTDERTISTEFEERSFWFRRFHTSLAIAHGGGFAAIGAKLFDQASGAALAAAALPPMAAFATGMIIAGALPLALQRRSERLAWWLATVSALLFVVGVSFALWAIWSKAGYCLRFEAGCSGPSPYLRWQR